MNKKQVDFGLKFLAAVSIVVSYAGLTTSVPQDSLWWKALCAAVATASGVAIYIFWKGAFEASVKPGQFRLRAAGWAATIAGCGFLLGMSSWWNVTAIGGNEAMKAAIYDALHSGEARLVSVMGSSTGYLAFVPRLESLAADLGSLAECEQQSGCVSGSGGAGGVSAMLDQMKGNAEAIIASLANADRDVSTQMDKGKACLAELRASLDRNASISDSSTEIDCINTAMAAVAGNGQLERIAQDLSSFISGLVIPVSVRTQAQKQALENVFAGIRERAEAIATDARAANRSVAVEPITVSRMSPMKAVIVYAGSIMPSWITGVALDLLPLVLLSFSSTLAASGREQPDLPEGLTIADALKALDALQKLDAARRPTVTKAEITAPSVAGAVPFSRIGYRSEVAEEDYWDEWIDVSELYDEDQPS